MGLEEEGLRRGCSSGLSVKSTVEFRVKGLRGLGAQCLGDCVV